jgi:hypothetical protein
MAASQEGPNSMKLVRFKHSVSNNTEIATLSKDLLSLENILEGSKNYSPLHVQIYRNVQKFISSY